MNMQQVSTFDNIYGTIIIYTYERIVPLDPNEIGVPTVYSYYPHVAFLDVEHKLFGYTKFEPYHMSDYEDTIYQFAIRCRWTYAPILKLAEVAFSLLVSFKEYTYSSFQYNSYDDPDDYEDWDD